MAELKEKLRGVEEIAGGGVAPGVLLSIALYRMERWQWARATEVWEDVDHQWEGEEEAGDWICYLSGMVATGKLAVEQARIIVRMIGGAWGGTRALVAAGEREKATAVMNDER